MTSYHFFIRLGVVPLAILMNKKRYDTLPEPVRAAMKKNGGEALGDQFTKNVGAYFAELLKRLQDDPSQHVIFPTEAEQDEARAQLAAVSDEWVAKSARHKELKAAVDAEIARVRKG